MATMLNPNAIPDGSITQQKIDPSVLEGKQSTLTDTDGGYGQRVAELEKEGIASQEKLSELDGNLYSYSDKEYTKYKSGYYSDTKFISENGSYIEPIDVSLFLGQKIKIKVPTTSRSYRYTGFTNDISNLSTAIQWTSKYAELEFSTENEKEVLVDGKYLLFSASPSVHVFSFSYKQSEVKAIKETIKHYVTPQQFGAKGDGITDDTNAFVSCANYCANNCPMIVPSGEYIINGLINLSNLSNLKIEGYGAKIIKPAGANTNVFYCENCSNITIEGLCFEGNKADGITYTWPRNINGCFVNLSSDNIRFINNKVENFNYGICVCTTGYNGWIVGNSFKNCNQDIDCYGKPSIFIDNNISEDCNRLSIQIEPSYDTSIENYYDNSVFNYKEQIGYRTICVGAIITNNTIVGCKGLSIATHSNTEDIVISNNNIINYGGIDQRGLNIAIRISNETSNVIVSNNVISNSLYKASALGIHDIEGSAIAIYNKAKNVMICNNVIRHAVNGIYITSNADSVCIDANMIMDSMSSAIVYGGKNGVISNNNIQNTSLSEYALDNADILISSNTNGVRIADNYLVNEISKAKYAIKVEDGAMSLCVKNNNCTSGYVALSTPLDLSSFIIAESQVLNY